MGCIQAAEPNRWRTASRRSTMWSAGLRLWSAIAVRRL